MIKRKRDRLDSMMRRKMPVMVGRMAKDHFQDNFRQGGFVNGGLHPWPKAKRLSSGGSDAASNYGTLLSGRKHLFKSVGYTPADYRVRVFNEVVYAPINNWGGEINVTVTDRMRRFAWAKFYKASGKRKKTGTGQKWSGKSAEDDDSGRRLSAGDRTESRTWQYSRIFGKAEQTEFENWLL